MLSKRWLAILGIVIAIAMFATPGRAQETAAPQGEPVSQFELEKLFFDLLLWTAVAGPILGLATGPSLRVLRHHPGAHFPSRARKLALLLGTILTVAAYALYVGEGLRRGFPLHAVLTYGMSALIPALFAILWYVTAYTSVRIPRWSGRYALWPRLKGGQS